MSKAALYRVEYALPRVTKIYLLLFGSLVRKVSKESTLVMVLLMSNFSRLVNYILEKRVAFSSAFLLGFASCIFYKIPFSLLFLLWFCPSMKLDRVTPYSL